MLMSKPLNIGAGWLKNTAKGDQFISCVAGDKQKGLKLLLQNASGETMEVSNFNVFFSANKKSPKAPDVTLTLFVEE